MVAFGILLTQPFVTPIAPTELTKSTTAVDPAILEAHVRKLAVDFYPRSHDHKTKLNAAGAYVREQLEATGAVVQTQQVKIGEDVFFNVIAHYGPKEGKLFVVGAHYDSHGHTALAEHNGQVSPSSHTPGADDNASGVAGLLEMGRLLGKRPPSRSVDLVAYTLEEPPNFRTVNMGSAWHARWLKSTKRDVEMMVALEMLGFYKDEPKSQAFPVPGLGMLYPDQGNFIALVGSFSDFAATRRAKALMAGASDLPVHSINAPKLLQGIDFSDHGSYWLHGFRAFMVTDTAFFRNANYHQAGDTPETLDYGRMAKAVEMVHALVMGF